MRKIIGIATLYQIRVDDEDESLCALGDEICQYLRHHGTFDSCEAFYENLSWKGCPLNPVRCSVCKNADEVNI
jgi:hypothetical protein